MAKAATKFSYSPAPGRLIVKPVGQQEMTASGLYLPEKAQERPQLGEVMAYTPGFWDDGKQKARRVRSGRHHLPQQVRRHRGQDRRLQDFLILREDDILAVKN